MHSHETIVECHVGKAYPDRPVAFRWEGLRLEVDEVERQWRTQGVAYDSPILYHYQVRTVQGVFRLVYDSDKDSWQITGQSGRS